MIVTADARSFLVMVHLLPSLLDFVHTFQREDRVPPTPNLPSITFPSDIEEGVQGSCRPDCSLGSSPQGTPRECKMMNISRCFGRSVIRLALRLKSAQIFGPVMLPVYFHFGWGRYRSARLCSHLLRLSRPFGGWPLLLQQKVMVRLSFLQSCASWSGGMRDSQARRPSKLKSVMVQVIGHLACIKGKTSLRTW